MTVNKPSSPFHPTRASFLRRRQPLDRQRSPLGRGKGTAETHEVHHHQHPFKSSLLYSDDKRFFMHGVDIRMEATQSQWRRASCGLKMQHKTEDLFDPIYFTSRFWSQSLTYLQKSLCWKCQVILFPPNPRRKTKHKKSVATPEFSQLCLKNRSLPKVYTLSSRECQLSALEMMTGDLCIYFWLDLVSFLAHKLLSLPSQQSIQSTLLH